MASDFTTHFMGSEAPVSTERWPARSNLRRLRVTVECLQDALSETAAPCDAQQIEQDLLRLVPAVVALREQGQQLHDQELVRLFLGDAAPRPVDIVRARMKAQARKQVFDGSEWLTAAQIAELAGLGTKNPSGTVNRWKNSGHIFALHVNGQDWYPRYGLGDEFRPLPAMADVIKELAGWKPERLASWFEAKSGALDGERPRELIASQPQRVVEAARGVVAAEAYGG